jgi:FAD-linked sulfhydryl oxidase
MTTPRQLFLILTFSAIAALVFVTSFRSGPDPNNEAYLQRQQRLQQQEVPTVLSVEDGVLSQASLTGGAIAPKLGNETLKAELGRAAWKLFHTTMARFPEKPTQDEQTALKTYIHLFQRLYPCGECAGHFGEVLKEYPPQVSSRNTAAGWACHVHNVVNESLGKDIFDCSKIGDFYDCGCAEDEEGDGKKKDTKVEREQMTEAEITKMTGRRGREVDPYKELMGSKIQYVKVT